MRRGARLRAAVALAIGFSACGGRATGALQTRYHEQTAAIQRLAVALEDAWYRRAHVLRPDTNPECITLTLACAVSNRDVRLEILRVPSAGLAWTQAWAPTLTRAVHTGRVVAFERDGTEPGSAFRATVSLQLDFRGDAMWEELEPTAPKTVSITVRITAVAKGGTVTGKYRITSDPIVVDAEEGTTKPGPLPASAGTLKGSSIVAVTPPTADAARWRPAPKAAAEDLYFLAGQIEGVADNWYRSIRALDISRRTGVSFSDALEQTPMIDVLRPSLNFSKAAQKKKKEKPPVSLDDLDFDGLGVDLPEDEPTGPDPAKTAELEKGLARLEQIGKRLQTMVDLVSAMEKADAAPNVIRDTLETEDPEFGPWYGEGSLDVREGVNVLPASAGSEDGAEDWRSVIAWEALGPFPQMRFDAVTPWLPDIVTVGSEVCRVEKDRVNDRYRGRSETRWSRCSTGPGRKHAATHGTFGYVVPPKWFSFNPYSSGYPPPLGYREYGGGVKHAGLPHSTAYLRCAIESPRTVTLWAGIGINKQGRLWVNRRLVWHGPPEPNRHYHETSHLVRIPLHKGRNDLLLRLDSDYATPYTWLRLCLRGKPRTAAEVKTSADAIARVRASLKPEGIVGWRGDGTGLYPDEKPPVAWNRKKKQNVLWRTPLPYFGNATPVPVPGSEKVFVTLEPCWLLCLDKNTGKELWRRAVSLLDLLPEPERKQGWALHEAWWAARRTVDSIPVATVTGRKFTAPKWLKYQPYWAEGTGIWEKGKAPAKDERDDAPPELIALLDKRDELEAAPNPVEVQDELNAVLKKIEAMQAKTVDDDPDSPAAKYKRLGKAEDAYVKHLGRFSHTRGMGGGYWSDYCGWMFSTPVTDGKHVWIKTGTDVAACFDLDGNEIWKVQTWGSGGADKTLCSPRLVDGLFIMQLVNNDRAVKSKKRGGVKMLALDAATGKEVWEVRNLPDNAWNASTPGVMTLTDGDETMKVLVTACGVILRVRDGKILVRNPGVQTGFASALVQDNTVLFGQGGMAPIQYIMRGVDRVGFRRPWAVRGGSHGVIDSGGAIIVDGRILHTTGIGLRIRGHGEKPSTPGLRAEKGAGEGWRALKAYDLATGAPAGSIPILRKGGHHWTPASASARHVYHIVGDHIFQHVGPKASMDMVVTTREASPLRLANNAIDRTYGAGAFENDRIYIRGYYGVTCVGYTGESGHHYEAEIVARNLLDDVRYRRPIDCPARDIPMGGKDTTIKRYPYKHPRSVYGAPDNCVILSGHAPHRYWMLGPVPPDRADEVLAAFGGPGQRLAGDETVRVAGEEYGFGPIYQAYLKVPDFRSWELDPKNFTDIHRLRRVVDLAKATQRRPGVYFLMTELRSEFPQVMRFEQPLPRARAWVGGVSASDGDRLRFGSGTCPFLLQVEVKEGATGSLELSPRFWASEDVSAEATAWSAAVEKREPYFREVIERAPDSPVADAAAAVLREYAGAKGQAWKR